VQTLGTSLLDVLTRQMSVSLRISFVILFFGGSLVRGLVITLCRYIILTNVDSQSTQHDLNRFRYLLYVSSVNLYYKSLFDPVFSPDGLQISVRNILQLVLLVDNFGVLTGYVIWKLPPVVFCQSRRRCCTCAEGACSKTREPAVSRK
jgi:hypothetical protein